MPKALVFLFAGLASSLVHAAPNPQVVCSYAPSQSKVVAGIAGGGGGLAAATAAIAKATGLVAVTHSSGAAILTGSSGYIAGTLGGASAAPFILGVGLLVGGAAVTVELICASKNHPDTVAKINVAATEFQKRTRELAANSAASFGKAKEKSAPDIERTKVEVLRIKGSVVDYAYKKGRDLKRTVGRGENAEPQASSK